MKYVITFLTIIQTLYCHAQDWNLEQCLLYGLENNRQLLSKQYTADIQRIEHKSIQGKLLPEISANANLDYYWKVPVQTLPGELVGQSPGTFITVPTSTSHAGSYGVDVKLNLINAEVWTGIKLEALKEQARRHEYASMEKLLSRNVSISFYLVQQYTKERTTTRQRYHSQKQVHELIEKKFNEGLLDQISFNQSLSLLKNQEEIFLQTDYKVENSLAELKFWMGFPLDSLLTIQQNTEIPTPEIPMFESRRLPDYEAERLKIDIAEKDYKARLSAFYPKLELVGNYGQLGFGETNRYITQSSAWHTSSFVGVRLSIPFFSMSTIRQSQKGKIMIAQAKQDFLYYEDSQQRAYLQHSNNLQSTWETLRIQEEKLHLAEENERFSIQKIESGIIDMLQHKQIQQDLIDEQNRYNQAITNYLKHYVEVIYLQSR
ncbi:MAG: TolC family protein [Tannerellaceae bacterium]|nr:TolC family protein [Tannerellaceae bacterium]